MFRISVLIVALVIQATTLTSVLVQAEDVPFMYPDPRTVGVVPPVIGAKPPIPVTPNRYAGVSEQERQSRIFQDQCDEIEGFEPEKREEPKCPLCEDDPKTPCGKCKMCLAGFPCEKTLCRHCVQPLSKNMGNNCDLTAGDEPCGTCDACREHRSDPCEHADDGYGPLGEFNPYHEPRLLSAIPRPILDTYNNGARKFPVYYNPAPYYRPTWNPSIYSGYARPYTFHWFCEHCHKNPCDCSRPGNAGQVSYGYVCKFCHRNPCACAQDICDSNRPMDPKGVAKSLEDMKKNDTGARARQLDDLSSDAKQSTSGSADAPKQKSAGGLYDDETPSDLESEKNKLDRGRGVKPKPQLDIPTPAPVPPTTGGTVSWRKSTLVN